MIFLSQALNPDSYGGPPPPDPRQDHRNLVFAATLFALAVALLSFAPLAHAGTSLPGTDASDKLEAAGTLLRMIDTGLFRWGARIFAGICIMSSAWALKEQRFGIAIICVIGAIIFGTAPTWVKNIFDIGGNQSIFSKINSDAHTLTAGLEGGGEHYAQLRNTEA